MIIDRLSEDHRNFGRVLDLLERQLNEVHKEGTPDFYLMLKILEYFQEYPSRYHHPAEDLLFSIYLQHGSKTSAVVNILRREHAELEELTNQLKGNIEAILLDGIVGRPPFESHLRNFLQQQRAHIALEESEMFPRMRQTLKDEDWNEVDARLSHYNDPLFGPKVRQEYEELYRHISG